MPFCSQCGKPASEADVFCFSCGARQPVAPAPPRRADPFSTVTPRTASILCYIPGIGWIAAIAVLASQRFRAYRTVRFNAFQGLYLFVAWLLEDWVLHPLFSHIPGVHLDGILKLALLGVSIFMMVKTGHDETVSLPVIGELAERSVAET